MVKDFFNKSKLNKEQKEIQDKVLSGKQNFLDKLWIPLSKVNTVHNGLKAALSVIGAYWALYYGPEKVSSAITDNQILAAIVFIFNFIVLFILLN